KSFIRGIIKNGHESVLEHEKVTVKVICSRSVSHRLVRHRIASYSQESTRWCNYTKKNDGHISFIIPTWSEIEPGTYADVPKNLSEDLPSLLAMKNEDKVWFTAMQFSACGYTTLVDMGKKPEEAQGVLAHSLKTELDMTMNLREWRHFFKERTAKVAGDEVRQLTVPMLIKFQAYIPIVFDDILELLEK